MTISDDWAIGQTREVSFNAERISQFAPGKGEAAFWPPAPVEVRGGMHIALEVVTIVPSGEFVMVVWPHGLPGHENERTVRFPHGLMRFGEAPQDACARLVQEQLGMSVSRSFVIDLDSYVDEGEHWHVEPHMVAYVTGDPNPPRAADGAVTFSGTQKPDGAVWSDTGFERLLNTLRLHGLEV